MNQNQKAVLKKRVLDDETRRKLSGLLPATSKYVINFIPDCFKDVPVDFKPTFNISPYTMEEMKELASISDRKMSDEESEEYAIDIARKHVVGFSNLIDISNNEEIKAEKDGDGISKDQFNKFPRNLILEIIKELTAISSGIR